MSDGLELVGRDTELAALLAAFEAAEAGQGTVVSLSGEPGVGKTATAAAFAAAARHRGARVLWGTCYEGTAQPPYDPWFQALAALTPGPQGGPVPTENRAGAHLSAPEARLRLFNEVHASLLQAARDGPVLLVLDDLQWASTDSLDLFAHIAARADRSSLLLLGTYRDPDTTLDGGTPLAQLLGLVVRLPRHVRVHLTGLAVEGVRLYLRRSLGDDVPATIARAVQAQTSGNPFYVREVAKVLVEEGKLVRRDGRWLSDFSLANLRIPETVRDAVRGRLAGLTGPTRALLQAASAFTGDLDLETVRAVAGLDESEALDAVDEAVATGFLRGTHSSAAPYGFAHAIVRHALAESLNPDRAARQHRRAAEVLERLRPDDHAAIAEQYALSRAIPGAERGLGHCLAAAEAATEEHAQSQAVRLLQLALELVPPPDARARSAVLCRLAVAQADALDVETAPATTLVALQGLPVDEAATLIVRVTEALGEGAPISAHEPLVRRGLELVGEARDARWARLAVLLDPVEPVGNGALRVGRWRGHPPDALAALRATGLEEDEARTIEPFRPRTEKASIALLEQSRRWSSARARLRVLDVVGRDFSLRHRQPLVAVDCYRGLLELGERVGSLPAQAEGSGMLAMCLALTGDLAAAEQQLVRARDLVRDVWPGHRAHLVGTISSSVIVGYLRGTADWSGMADRLSQWLAGPGPSHAPFAIVFAALAALCHSFAGERDDAVRMLDEVVDVIGLMDVRDHAIAGTLWFSAASVWELRDAVRAERLGGLINRHLAADGPPGPASLAHARGRMLAVRGDRRSALSCFEVAGKEVDVAGLRGMRALLDWEDASVRGDAAAASAATSAFDELGMRGWAARARAEASSSAPVSVRPFGLTEREVEVLGRLAAGRTSSEIAGDLVISVATVNRHIANIYLKIDARNRAEATSIAIAQGLAGSSP